MTTGTPWTRQRSAPRGGSRRCRSPSPWRALSGGRCPTLSGWPDVSATVFFNDVNELATLTNVFKVNGVPTDATTVTLTVTDPTGAVTTPATTHPSTGTYTANVACPVVGIWSYLWEGTGTAQDAVAGTWTVTTTALGQRYCSVEEMKSRLGIADTADDLELQLAAESASRQIDEITGRYFWRGSATRTYVPESIYYQSTGDLVS